ncbi:MAG: hypothetical protein JNL10_00240 [Verrucomicrobiales bacterium]|nr:hypothetical protein [Verrucomicrobiales bacterium]
MNTQTRTLAALLILIAALVAGCASQKFGGQMFSVTLESEPPGGRAFVVPLSTWDTSGQMAIIDNPGLASRYACDSPTPTTRSIYDMPHMYVVVLNDGRRGLMEIDPALNSPNRFIIRFP